MASTMWVGTTGLAASEQMMNVIGDNLANANTAGFKESEISFASMLSQNLAGGSGAQGLGQGVSVAAIRTDFKQGTLQATSRATDVAIDGNGFFILKDKENVLLYSRAGSFHINSTGLLADNSNYTVQGYMFDNDGILELKSLTDLNLRVNQSKPRATTTFSAGLTLDSQTPAGDTFNASQAVYDSRGAAYNLNTIFMKTGNPEYWSVQTSLQGQAADSQLLTATGQTFSGIKFNAQGTIDKVYTAAGTPAIASAGGGTATAAVLNEGQLYQATPLANPITLTMGAAPDAWTITDNGGYANLSVRVDTSGASPVVGIDLDGADGNDVTFALSAAGWAAGDTIQYSISQTEVDRVDNQIRFYPATGDGSLLPDGAAIGNEGVLTWRITGADILPITTYATASRIIAQSNDGYAAGDLTTLKIDKDGIVEGKFSNGQTQKLARLLLADFSDPQGLHKAGSYFNETATSGAATLNKPGAGGLGALQASSLEVSNTDVATEFVKMITAQRAYQSSAKIITTADQMLQELMRIKQ